MKEEKELVLYVNRNISIKRFLEEAVIYVELDAENGSGQLRILEICVNKLLSGPKHFDLLDSMWNSISLFCVNLKTNWFFFF